MDDVSGEAARSNCNDARPLLLLLLLAVVETQQWRERRRRRMTILTMMWSMQQTSTWQVCECM